jgi:hypothetical protein
MLRTETAAPGHGPEVRAAPRTHPRVEAVGADRKVQNRSEAQPAHQFLILLRPRPFLALVPATDRENDTGAQRQTQNGHKNC